MLATASAVHTCVGTTLAAQKEPVFYL